MFEKLKKTDKNLYICVLITVGLCLLAGIILFIDSGNGRWGFDLGNTDIVWLLAGIVAAASIVLDYYLAGLFYFLGVDKGYYAKAYLRIAYFIPAVGYLLIIAMPDRGGNPQFANDELPEL